MITFDQIWRKRCRKTINISDTLNHTITYKGHAFKVKDFIDRIKAPNDQFDAAEKVLSSRTYYYLKMLSIRQDLSFKGEGNWASFIFSTFWLAYRGAFWTAFMIGIMYFLLNQLIYYVLIKLDIITSVYNFIMNNVLLSYMPLILYSILFGLYGNTIYLRGIAQDIIKNKPLKRSTSISKVFLLFLTGLPIGICIIIMLFKYEGVASYFLK